MWEARGSMLVNVGKCSKRTSSFSRLGTSMGTTNKVCALDIESSPDMVIVSPNPWKWMFFVSYTLVADGDRGISISEALAASLEDEPFSPVLCFFYEDLNSMASLNHLCCHSKNLTCRLAAISSFLASSIISGTTGLTVSHHSICSTLNISSGSVTVSWTWGQTTVFFFTSQRVGFEATWEVELRV